MDRSAWPFYCGHRLFSHDQGFFFTAGVAVAAVKTAAAAMRPDRNTEGG